MAFEHLTFFEVHVHPGAEDSIPKRQTEDTTETTTRSAKGGSKRRTVLGLVAASIVVSILASVAAKRMAGRFSDGEETETTTDEPAIEITE